MENLVIYLTDSILANAAEATLLVASIAFVLSVSFRDSLLKFVRLFLYRDSSIESTDSNKSYEKLEKRIKTLETELTGKVLSDRTKLIQKEVDRFLDESLPSVIQEKIDREEFVKSSVIGKLENTIEEITQKYLEGTSSAEIQRSRSEQQKNTRRSQSNDALVATLEKEERSASMLKMIMINLFVSATAIFIFFNAIGKMTFDLNTTIAVVSLYVSLGAFMLYIIRTSHFRSSVLLAIREDERNYHNFEEFVSSFKANGDLSEHDVDVIRMIMTNRSEREQKADHPYEVILKSVSGSNIQFKGGKMTLGGDSAAKTGSHS